MKLPLLEKEVNVPHFFSSSLDPNLSVVVSSYKPSQPR